MFLIDTHNVCAILKKRYNLELRSVDKMKTYHHDLYSIKGIEVFKALENALSVKEKKDFSCFVKSKMLKFFGEKKETYEALECYKHSYELQLMVIIMMQYYFCI